MDTEFFFKSKPMLDDCLNHFDAGPKTRNEAYRLYALGEDRALENLVADLARLETPHPIQ